MNIVDVEYLVTHVHQGDIWAMQTDTIMGLCCRYNDEEAKQKIIEIKNRQHNQSFVTLIDDIQDIESRGIAITTDMQSNVLGKIWPGPVSVAFGDKDAYRMPDNDLLRGLIDKTGPLVATSLNKSGHNVLSNLEDAYKMFGENIDYYVETNIIPRDEPSSIIKIIR